MARKKTTKTPANLPASETTEERITRVVRDMRQRGASDILVRKWKHPQYIAIGPRFGCGLLFVGPYVTTEELERSLPQLAAIVEKVR
jgi:hypothetical protein